MFNMNIYHQHITEAAKEVAPKEVVCILDVQPLASHPLTKGQGLGAARERPSFTKGVVVQPFMSLAPRPSVDG
jgi:hypothetical protein